MSKAFFLRPLRLFLLLVLTLVSCKGINKQELEKKVRSDIEQKFDQRAARNNIDYRIKKFQLTHRGGNEYTGLLRTVEDGREFSYNLEVVVDGNSYQWQIVN